MVATNRRRTVLLTGGMGVAVALAFVPMAPGGTRVPAAAASPAPSPALSTGGAPSGSPTGGTRARRPASRGTARSG